MSLLALVLLLAVLLDYGPCCPFIIKFDIIYSANFSFIAGSILPACMIIFKT